MHVINYLTLSLMLIAIYVKLFYMDLDVQEIKKIIKASNKTNPNDPEEDKKTKV